MRYYGVREEELAMVDTPRFAAPRPDQAHWARVQAGLVSPLWLPFVMAASAGAAWWTYANFARWSQPAWGGRLDAAQEPDPPAQTAKAAEPIRAPEPAAAPPAANENLTAAAAPDPAPEAPAVAPETVTPQTGADDDGADAIDAAYAANLGPVLEPAAKARKKPKAPGKKKG